MNFNGGFDGSRFRTENESPFSSESFLSPKNSKLWTKMETCIKIRRRSVTICEIPQKKQKYQEKKLNFTCSGENKTENQEERKKTREKNNGIYGGGIFSDKELTGWGGNITLAWDRHHRSPPGPRWSNIIACLGSSKQSLLRLSSIIIAWNSYEYYHR